MTQVIEIVIAPDGQAKLQTKGFAGQTCQGASQFLEEALGHRFGETLTAEFYNSQSNLRVDQRQS